jgi:hypothetical protein
MIRTAVLHVLALLFLIGCGGEAPARGIPGDRDPAITVEVLNANGRAGDARAGTRLLRRAGIDVVYFGNAPAAESTLDSTRIIVRRGDRKIGEKIRAALRVGTIVVQLDSARLLDASVLLGADFSAVARSSLDFHP